MHVQNDGCLKISNLLQATYLNLTVNSVLEMDVLKLFLINLILSNYVKYLIKYVFIGNKINF